MYDEIVTAVDFANVGIAIVAIAASFAIALVIMKGASMVIDMINGSDESYWDGYDEGDEIASQTSFEGVTTTEFEDGHVMTVDSNGPNPALMTDDEFAAWSSENS